MTPKTDGIRQLPPLQDGEPYAILTTKELTREFRRFAWRGFWMGLAYGFLVGGTIVAILARAL